MVFVAIGFVIGSLVDSAELAVGVATVVQLLALFTSGVVFPTDMLSPAIVNVIRQLPPTYMADWIVHALGQPYAQHSYPLAVLVTSLTALVAVGAAVVLFRWERVTAKA